MKLYHGARTCSLAVDIVARELGLPLQIEWVEMSQRRLADGSDYHRIDPKGTVPTLQLDDGQCLSQAAVIMQYLTDLRPGSPLLAPPGTMARWRTLEWMSFIGADLHRGGFTPLFKAATPPAYKRVARAYLDDRLRWMNEQLAGRDYLTGATFTIADAHGYTVAMWTRLHDIDTTLWPHLESYLARVGARPCVQAAEQAVNEQGERERAQRVLAAALAAERRP